MYAPDHDFRAFSHSVDHVAEAGEKLEAGIKILNGAEFVKTRPRTERLVFGAAQYHHFGVGIAPGGFQGRHYLAEQTARQTVVVRVIKNDVRYTVCGDVGANVALLSDVHFT